MSRRANGRVLELRDRYGAIDVFLLPTKGKILAWRWPRSGRVIVWTLGEPVASTFVFGDVKVPVVP